MTISEKIEILRRAGYRNEPPGGWSGEVAKNDADVVTNCSKCGVPMVYSPWTREDGYIALALCHHCNRFISF